MYFNQDREDTNIDSEFRNKKNFDFGKYKIPLIVLGVVVLLIVIIIIIASLNGNQKIYFIDLNESNEITIYEGSAYNEPGYSGFDNMQNNLTSEVIVNGDVDTNTIGTYTITYSLHGTVKTRTVKVVAKQTIATFIHLNGDMNIKLKVGDTYNEPGYSAIDTIDGDITNKVTTNGSVDTSKRGTYRVVYSVINSSGVTTSETRTIVVE